MFIFLNYLSSLTMEIWSLKRFLVPLRIKIIKRWDQDFKDLQNILKKKDIKDFLLLVFVGEFGLPLKWPHNSTTLLPLVECILLLGFNSYLEVILTNWHNRLNLPLIYSLQEMILKISSQMEKLWRFWVKDSVEIKQVHMNSLKCLMDGQ